VANEGYHESSLREDMRGIHRTVASLMEELVTVDWCNQHVDACQDPELCAILAHNRDEDKEHVTMVLERVRRRDPAFHKELSDYLITDKPIASLEAYHKS